jgi:ribonuclease BN (tRNA processing enzyme)
VLAREVPHVGRTLGYRIEVGGVSVAYLPDHQQPMDGSLTVADSVLELVDGVDLLIHDAQFLPEEFARKANWGHCTIEYAVLVARQGGARRLALFHHDPLRSDEELDRQTRCAWAAGQRLGVDVIAAAEGMELALHRC